jgi:hypothetical protein
MCAAFGAYCVDIDSVGALALITRDLELVDFLDMRVLQILLLPGADAGLGWREIWEEQEGLTRQSDPTPGTYGESVIEAPTSSHAAKASFDLKEQLYPNVPNTEPEEGAAGLGRMGP